MAVTDPWVDSVIGRSIEVEDSTNRNQCYDLVASYCQYRGIPLSAIRHLYAYQIWTAPVADTYTYFDFIPVNQLQNGDVVVFGTSVGFAGHVDVFESWVVPGKTWIGIDQNWNGHPYAERVTHTTNGVLGGLRPKTQGGSSMANITQEEEKVLALMATGSLPGKDYNYRFSGLPATSANLDAMLQFWQGQSILPDRLARVEQLTQGESNQFVRANTAEADLVEANKQIEALKAEVGKENNVDPNSIVITSKGWQALFDAVKSFFVTNK